MADDDNDDTYLDRPTTTRSGITHTQTAFTGLNPPRVG